MPGDKLETFIIERKGCGNFFEVGEQEWLDYQIHLLI